jgi:hypothetical protein
MSDTGATDDTKHGGDVDLQGSWRKSAAEPSDVNYPDVLDLLVVEPGAGRYLGRKGNADQGFLQWDAGTWRLTEDSRLEISTATDALDSWPVTISADEMQIHVAEGVLTYRRSGPDD